MDLKKKKHNAELLKLEDNLKNFSNQKEKEIEDHYENHLMEIKTNLEKKLLVLNGIVESHNLIFQNISQKTEFVHVAFVQSCLNSISENLKNFKI